MRDLEGITVKELAFKAEVAPQTIYKILDGTTLVPGTKTARKLAKVLKVSTDWLLGVDSNNIVLTVTDHDHYWQEVANLLGKVEREISIQLRAGTTIQWHELLTPLENLMMDKAIDVNLIICNENHDESLHVIGSRRKAARGSSRRNKEVVKQDIRDNCNRILTANKHENTHIHIQPVPYPVSHIVFIADPIRKDLNDEWSTPLDSSQALVLLFNFQDDLENAPMILVKESQDEDLFKFFCEDFQRLWDFGKANYRG